jgi:DNA-binding response OmpR family regulator
MTDISKKILVIEDDRECAALVAEALADRGFEVSFAYDGIEGFVSILEGKPDLVLCDFSLPIMSCLEVLKHLRNLVPPLAACRTEVFGRGAATARGHLMLP